MEGLFIPLSFFASIVLIVYIYISNRNKERMALIDKGMDASIFQNKAPGFRILSFKLGFFLVGLGIGLLIGNILAAYTQLLEEVAYFSMLLLFGGASLIVFHLLEKTLLEKYHRTDL
jgi:hypothetical protein